MRAINVFNLLLILALVACRPGDTSAQPPLFIMEQDISDNRGYVNFNVDEIQILGKTGDPVGKGEFRLLIIGADTEGRSSGTFCPGDEPIKIQTGDIVRSPCLFVISFDESQVSDGVFLMVIVVDEDESSLPADLSYELVTNKLGEALGKAVTAKILGVASTSNPYAVATQVLVSYLGGKVKNWFEKADTIGAQGVFLSRSDNWSAGKQTTVTSGDGGIRLTYTVTRSSSDQSQLDVQSGEENPIPTPQPSVTPIKTLIARATATIRETATPELNDPEELVRSYPRIYDFSACLEPCNGKNGQTDFFKKVMHVYLTWKYENIPTGAHYVRKWIHEERGTWVTYDCSWPGPPTGEVNVSLYDYKGGLTSGNWYITITVDEEVLLRERIFVEGNYQYWEPVGTINTCYSTNE